MGCAILIGCASERAICLLIDSYAEAISDPVKRQSFKDKISSKFVSKAYEIFKQSIRSSKNRPELDALFHDWHIQIESLFQFFRICRNEVGHPITPPNIGRAALLANLGQFDKYIGIIYNLIRYFSSNSIVV